MAIDSVPAFAADIANTSGKHDQFNTKTQPISRDWYPERPMTGTLPPVSCVALTRLPGIPAEAFDSLLRE